MSSMNPADTPGWGDRSGTAFADGVPAGAAERLGAPIEVATAGDHARAATKLFRGWRATFARVFEVEGERGLALRYSVVARYAAYLGVILACCGLAHFAFVGTTYSSAGIILLFCSTTMVVAAAAGTMFMPHRRDKVITDLRTFLFSGVLFPTAAESVFAWVLRTSSNGTDGFMGLLQTALPVMFMANTVIPALVFLKTVAGQRALERTQSSDAEMMATWTRQDDWQR